ncbi:MAG: ribosome biogenesis protein [Candidatus Heimdallarchaeota archaeon]|nr:ribosome biogenesis protein [Candidatus Heimdallarchaeota archaeon]
MHKCLECGTYTLSETCPKCSGKAVSPHPAKFSIIQAKKYGKYRRELRRRVEQKK